MLSSSISIEKNNWILLAISWVSLIHFPPSYILTWSKNKLNENIGLAALTEIKTTALLKNKKQKPKTKSVLLLCKIPRWWVVQASECSDSQSYISILSPSLALQHLSSPWLFIVFLSLSPSLATFYNQFLCSGSHAADQCWKVMKKCWLNCQNFSSPKNLSFIISVLWLQFLCFLLFL